MVDVVLGLQWGDEGKGKIADFLTPRYDVVARFQGGPNAGHSLEMNGKKHVLNTIPSGIFHENCKNVIGNGVVIDPVRFMEEIRRTEEAGADVKSRLFIGRKASLIMPTHKVLDAAYEQDKGDAKIGSTLRGIGPTYRDKYGRAGMRIGDIFDKDFEARYRKVIMNHLKTIEQLSFTDFKLGELEWEFFDAVEALKAYQFVDSEYFVNDLITSDKKVLAEGAQGSMLDIDFGSYPFVTSSNTISGGVTVGLGVAPKHISTVRGIFKAYCTRVGGGPFPSELDNDEGQLLRDRGHEYGATTGRPRRCGWLDLVALKYAVMLSGVDELIMMKADVLSGIEQVGALVAYEIDGKRYDTLPYDLCRADLKPIFEYKEGWSEDLTGMRSENELPQSFRNYVSWIEKETGVPVKILSVGPDRSQTIIR